MRKYRLQTGLSKGVTLVELLVAVTISATVAVIAFNIYFSSKKNYKLVKSKSQQDIRELTAKKVFYDVITNAGLSCKYGSKNQIYINRTAENPLNFGFMYDSSPVRIGKIASIAPFLMDSLGAGAGTAYQPDTDYIMVKSEDSFTTLTSKVTNLDLDVKSKQHWVRGDYLALCNNDYINIVKVANINSEKNIVNLAAAPSDEYHKDDYVGKYSILIFYIAANPTKDHPEDPNYSLFLYTKTGSHEAKAYPLIDGASDLDVSYSILNRDNLSWRDVTSNTDLDNIKAKAIKISFRVAGQKFEKIILL